MGGGGPSCQRSVRKWSILQSSRSGLQARFMLSATRHIGSARGRERPRNLHKLLRIVPDLGLARLATYGICVSSPQVSVLVVEDDPGIATQLVRGLERAGYTADSVAMGAEALRRPPSDVVLLDLGLPDIDGIDVCRRLRADSDTAIIVVTARGEEADRVLALDEGADDYLVKPFGLAELLARIRAVLRRGQRLGGGSELLRHGPLTVDLRTRKVIVSGAEVALTPKEFAILECLAADPGRLVSRQEIVERALG